MDEPTEKPSYMIISYHTHDDQWLFWVARDKRGNAAPWPHEVVSLAEWPERIEAARQRAEEEVAR